jgi:hypothetical protein
MSDERLTEKAPEAAVAEKELQSRRDFLIGLGRWSKIVIGATLLGGIGAGAPDAQAGAWVNRRGGYGGGGAWVNNRYGGGGAWVNNRGGYGGGGAWVNRR